MKSIILSLIITLSSACSFAQQNEAVTKLIKEGIELHDKDLYEAAIKKYDEALLLDKDNYDASYEKSLSCLYAKRYDECVAISKYLLDKHNSNPEIKNVYSNYGSALDDDGKGEAAIAIFDKGIKQFPDFYLLHFNKALTLGRLKKWDEAMPSFITALKNKPNHAGSLYYTSMLLENSNKVAAIISCLTFLAVEPEGKRAKSTLQYLDELLASFAKKGKDGGNVISIDAGDLDNKKKENNFSMVQVMLGLTAASSLADSVKAKTAVEKLSLQIQMMSEALSTGKKEGKGIFWEVYAPFFIEMKKQELVPVFAHIAYITSGNEENIKWISDNQDKLQEFYKWVGEYKWDGK